MGCALEGGHRRHQDPGGLQGLYGKRIVTFHCSNTISSGIEGSFNLRRRRLKLLTANNLLASWATFLHPGKESAPGKRDGSADVAG